MKKKTWKNNINAIAINTMPWDNSEFPGKKWQIPFPYPTSTFKTKYNDLESKLSCSVNEEIYEYVC